MHNTRGRGLIVILIGNHTIQRMDRTSFVWAADMTALNIKHAITRRRLIVEYGILFLYAHIFKEYYLSITYTCSNNTLVHSASTLPFCSLKLCSYICSYKGAVIDVMLLCSVKPTKKGALFSCNENETCR